MGSDAPAAGAAPLELDLFPTTRLQILGSIVVLQPVWREEVVGPSLTLDLETGTLSAGEHPPILTDFTPSYGALGIAKLEGGPALAVITGLQQVATIRGHPLFRVTATKVLAARDSDRWSKEDRRLLGLFEAAVDPERHGFGLYIGYGGDVTLTEQRAAELVAPKTGGAQAVGTGSVQAPAHGAWSRADLAVTWNAAAAEPLVSAGLGAFVPPAFAGFAERLEDVRFDAPGREASGAITLLARRARARAGTRQWRRGAGRDGLAANFVETEQVVELGSIVASHVQVRGSVPVLWAQSPTLAYKIPIEIAPRADNAACLAAHAQALSARYGSVTAVSLANLTGREGKLSEAYRLAVLDSVGSAGEALGERTGSELEGGAAGGTHPEAVPSSPGSKPATAASSPGGYRLELFDFHKECGHAKYERLSVLWDSVMSDFTRYGYWLRDDERGVGASQRGVFRTNCIDTLDRTNVVQGLLGRKALEHLLTRLGLLEPGADLARAFPEVERRFRVAWADHGDAISRQYAGTGAMKSAFTRTGKRDAWGLADDGLKSLTRYVLNNFRDGRKQDAFDFFTGAANGAAAPKGKDAHGDTGPSEPAWGGSSPALILLAIIVSLALAISSLRDALSRGGAIHDFVRFLAALAAGVTLFLFLAKNGTRFVDGPTLRRDLVRVWKN